MLLSLSISVWYKFLPSRRVLTVKLVEKYSFIMEDLLSLYNYNCSLCWTNSVQFATLCQLSLELFLIFSSHMCFDLPHIYFHFSFRTHLLFSSFCENFSFFELWLYVVFTHEAIHSVVLLDLVIYTSFLFHITMKMAFIIIIYTKRPIASSFSNQHTNLPAYYYIQFLIFTFLNTSSGFNICGSVHHAL